MSAFTLIAATTPTAYEAAHSTLVTASFAFAAMTLTVFSIVFFHLKHTVYDSADYRDRIRARRVFDPTHSTHGALWRFFLVGISVVMLCVLSGATNLTAYFVDSPLVRGFGIGFAITALADFLLLLISMALNVRAMIRWSSQQAEKDIASKPKAA